MNIERRWLKSVVAASAAQDAVPAMPWARATRKRPAAMKPAPVQMIRMAVAAR